MKCNKFDRNIIKLMIIYVKLFDKMQVKGKNDKILVGILVKYKVMVNGT